MSHSEHISRLNKIGDTVDSSFDKVSDSCIGMRDLWVKFEEAEESGNLEETRKLALESKRLAKIAKVAAVKACNAAPDAFSVSPLTRGYALVCKEVAESIDDSSNDMITQAEELQKSNIDSKDKS